MCLRDLGVTPLHTPPVQLEHDSVDDQGSELSPAADKTIAQGLGHDAGVLPPVVVVLLVNAAEQRGHLVGVDQRVQGLGVVLLFGKQEFLEKKKKERM